MKTSNLLTSEQFTDTYIREVVVNYVSSSTPNFPVREPSDVVQFMRSLMPDNSREHFVALYLDASHRVIAYSLISTGTANCAYVHPREVFQRAIVVGSIAVIVAHNHPSGSLVPSQEDKNFTKRLDDASDFLGIKLLDSLVITDNGAHSIKNDSPVSIPSV